MSGGFAADPRMQQSLPRSKLLALLKERAIFAFAFAWLLAIGVLVWLHAQQSLQPPIYDAFTYYSKAKAVWDDLLAGRANQILSAEPTFRPPGTVLLSYPFGFDADFRGFYFRSVYFPVVLVFAAVFVVAWRSAVSFRAQSIVALTAAFLSTVALFYYFEPYHDGPPAESQWGLVDGFLTGLAALTAACGVSSIPRRSFAWAVPSALIGALMIFVKPTGVLIAAITGAIVALGWLRTVHVSWRDRDDRRTSIRDVAVLFAIQIVVLGGAVLSAIKSRYLGPSNMMYGNAAIDVMRAELGIDLSELLDHVRGGIGPFIPVWGVALTAIWVVRARARPTHTGWFDKTLMAFAAVTLVIGVWFWLYGSGGGTQVRYVVPFVLVAIVCALEPVLKALDDAPRAVRVAVSLFMIGVVVNTTLLLALPDPSAMWQRVAGVNVKSGTRPPGIEQAHSIIAKTQAGTEAVIVYSMTAGISDAVITAVFDVQWSKAKKPRFSVTRPVDWQRPSAFRVDEIVAADYILFDPTEVPSTVPESIVNLGLERAAFEGWANRLTRADGIDLESAAATSSILRIVDRAKLRESLARLVRAHRWRDAFLSDNPPKFWSSAQVDRVLANPTSLLANVRFEDKFVVPAMIVQQTSGGSTELRLWFRPSAAVSEGDWAVFVHMIDDQGVTTADRSFVLGDLAKDPAPPDAPFSYLHARFVPPRDTVKIGVGFYRSSTILEANKGERDWGGKRILFAVKPPAR